MKTFNILISGTGGQGTVFLGEFLSSFFIEKGFIPNSTKMHGFSQRGGSVLYFLRLSTETYVTPLIPEGEVHAFIVLLERDRVRYGKYLNSKTIFHEMKKENPMFSSRFQNMYLLGKFFKDLDFKVGEKIGRFSLEEVENFMKKSLKKNLEDNLQAFKTGYLE